LESGRSIITKANIRSFKLDKGTRKKLYCPDCVITIGGYPLVVIEGKAPNTDLDEAHREARLYAAELNGIYPSGVNPVSIICVTNGKSLWVGPVDQSDPTIKMSHAEVDVTPKAWPLRRN
jgi:type I site-specific restriction endonuclease